MTVCREDSGDEGGDWDVADGAGRSGVKDVIPMMMLVIVVYG